MERPATSALRYTGDHCLRCGRTVVGDDCALLDASTAVCTTCVRALLEAERSR